MSIRNKKTRRRLFIVLAIAFAVIATAGVGATIRLAYLRKTALQGRERGLAAMAQNDYPTALAQLGHYLSRYPNDADILLLYAKARQNVADTNNSNLGQAISLYRRVLELHPGLYEAQHNLLDLYVEVGFNTEAIALAGQIISSPPNNPSDAVGEVTHALRSKTSALLRMGKLDEAQATLQQLTKVAPLALDIRILELQVMLKKGAAAHVTEYANQLALNHPNDVRFELLKSIAASLVGNTASATNLVRPLVTKPQADAMYTRLLVRQLDSVGLFDESFSVIQQATEKSTDREMNRLWFRRLYETDQFSRLIQQTDDLDSTAAGTDVEALALRVMALVRVDRLTDAKKIVIALDKRGQSETPAAKWGAALRAVALHESPDPVKSVGALRDALMISPDNPMLLEEIGEAYAEAGSHDKAMSAWNVANRAAPAWAEPLTRISQSFLTAGRVDSALGAARAAELRAPHNHDVRVSLAIAMSASLPEGPSPDAEKLLAMIAEIQSEFPSDTELLPLKVQIFAREDRLDDARNAMNRALTLNPPLSERVLLTLARVSQLSGLNEETACWDVSEKAHGLSPNLVFARASWLRDHQRGAEALSMLQDARAHHPENDLSWRSIWAEYLDISGDQRAKGEWIALGDANPDDVAIQWGAVSAASVQADHDFMGRTIDRLVKLIGEDSVSLRLLRAQWFLGGQSRDTDTTQAAILLGGICRSAPDLLAPRLLLATCYMRLGNTTGAIDQLSAASDAQPDLAPLSIEVARLLQSHGDFSRAVQYIDRACASKHVNGPVLRQAAGLLALQGDYPASLALLQRVYQNEKQMPPDLMLAALYRQLNQPAKTSEICRQLLEKPDPSSVAFAADFYASEGNKAEATSALALLNKLDLPVSKKSLILANYAARHGTTDEALKDFQAAAHEAPQDPAVWQQLVAFCFSCGKIGDAITAAEQATAALSSASGFEVIKQNSQLIKDAGNVPALRPLLGALTGDIKTDAPVLEAVRDVVSADQRKEFPAKTAATLRQLADHNPRVLVLQTIAMEFYIQSGQIDDAVQLATRTVQSFPGAVEPLRVETNLLGTQQRWDEALGAAKEWRRRDSSPSIDPDLAIARAELQLGDVNAANQQIQPYFDRAIQDPDKFSGVLLLRARGLLASNQPEKVEELFSPLLVKSERARTIWVSLAMRSVDDPERAQNWLTKVNGYTTGKVDEQLNLANAWILIGKRWNRADNEQTGRKLLHDLAQAPDAAPATLLSWAISSEEVSDWIGAQQAYRRVLANDPNNVVALNNLASVLVKSGGNLDEAQQLIDKALARYPNTPDFLDTKAMVQNARKDFNGAISSLKEAQRLDSQNFKWRVNLLMNLIDAGQTTAAKSEMQQIAAALPTFPNVPPDLRQRYASLCAKIQ